MQLFDTIKHSAEAEIGVKKPQQKQHYSQDNQLSTLIEKNTRLRAELHADNRARDKTVQRTLILIRVFCTVLSLALNLQVSLSNKVIYSVRYIVLFSVI